MLGLEQIFLVRVLKVHILQIPVLQGCVLQVQSSPYNGLVLARIY